MDLLTAGAVYTSKLFYVGGDTSRTYLSHMYLARIALHRGTFSSFEVSTAVKRNSTITDYRPHQIRTNVYRGHRWPCPRKDGTLSKSYKNRGQSSRFHSPTRMPFHKMWLKRDILIPRLLHVYENTYIILYDFTISPIRAVYRYKNLVLLRRNARGSKYTISFANGFSIALRFSSHLSFDQVSRASSGKR